RRARIALAAGAAAELVVDAARLVALGADDVQAARSHHPVALLAAQALVPLEALAEAGLVGLRRLLQLLADLGHLPGVDGALLVVTTFRGPHALVVGLPAGFVLVLGGG